ncbi:hypothetical protein DPSP01_006395 [Paraphaeosphaeria sporulosa]|uniref:DUF7703 domain-containing protein n=1 Tax=Paraphaeosphaeria sporulosa TaxID=1460663 RepID=A0A177CHD7_9PLEO|nr:uncharacterized protein CC84DRAFT_1259456 [Paraphaeosphaeria sporulosa]OAG06200.1 hypothetical protein CC84DRAFT_1259456 [Paraphaeosphaeria sporulosa]
MVKKEDVGIVGGVNVGLPVLMTMGAFLSIALYNVIEITVLIFIVFKQRKGMYFWSCLTANWGIVPHAVGFILKFFQVTTLDLLSSAIIGVGWACMVIGQSVVLYSRLHLVVQDKTKIRWVLCMIVFNGVVLGCPLIILALGTNSKQSARFLPGFLIYDKVQIVVVSVQETIISIIYIYETVHLLGPGGGSSSRPLKKLLMHLIFVNVMVLVFDITLLAVQFSGHYELQTTYKTAVYSVKLKMEFSVLNRLVRIVKHKDITSNRRALGSNTLSLGVWTGNKKAQISTSPRSPGASVKINEISSTGDNSEDTNVRTSQISIDRAETAGTALHTIDSDSNGT